MKFTIVFFLFINLFASPESHKYKHIYKELSHLNLTKEQNKQIKDVLQEFQTQLKKFRKFKRTIEKQKKDIFIKETLDIKTLDNLNIALDAKAHKIENMLLKEFHIILDDEQKRKFIYYFDDWEVE